MPEPELQFQIGSEIRARFEESCNNSRVNPNAMALAVDSDDEPLGAEYVNSANTVAIIPPGGHKIWDVKIEQYNEQTTNVKIEPNEASDNDILVFQFNDTAVRLKRRYVDIICNALDYSLKEYIESTYFASGPDIQISVSCALTMHSRAFGLIAPRV